MRVYDNLFCRIKCWLEWHEWEYTPKTPYTWYLMEYRRCVHCHALQYKSIRSNAWEYVPNMCNGIAESEDRAWERR